MTLVEDSGSCYSPDTAAPGWRPRTELELLAQQLHAISTFTALHRLREQACVPDGASREMRMDAARSLDVVRREHEALVARAHEQLTVAGDALGSMAERRVVLAHRNQWFVEKVAQALEGHGLRVLARVDNGADAVGVVIAEQPDLVLVEDTLVMLPGEDVVREVRRFAPESLVVAQVPYGDRVGQMLDAGASAVFTRQIPPQDVALALLRLLTP